MPLPDAAYTRWPCVGPIMCEAVWELGTALTVFSLAVSSHTTSPLQHTHAGHRCGQ